MYRVDAFGLGAGVVGDDVILLFELLKSRY